MMSEINNELFYVNILKAVKQRIQTVHMLPTGDSC